jgi:hypothetical protein
MSDETPELTAAAIADRARAYVRENFLYMRPDWQANLGSLGAIVRFVHGKRNSKVGTVRPHQVA